MKSGLLHTILNHHQRQIPVCAGVVFRDANVNEIIHDFFFQVMHRKNNGRNALGLTQAVATGQLTIDEAHEFGEFLRRQRYVVEEAERKIRYEEIKQS